MKALKILKSLRKAFGKHDKNLEDAISELEALQEPKTCEGCLYKKGTDYSCFKCERYYAGDDFYEPKDKK
jgi:hypothetical protein